MTDLQIEAIGPERTRDVLRIALAAPDQTPADLERHVSGFIQYARRMSLSLQQHWMALRGGRPVSACVCLEFPGRTAMLFIPPGEATEADDDVTVRLVRHALSGAAQRDIRVVQCLLDPFDMDNHRRLRSAGMSDLAILQYLERETADTDTTALAVTPETLQDAQLDWITYDEPDRRTFANLILATYQDSRDCRGLTGLRDIDDVLAGHRSAGLFLPRRWSLLRVDRQPAACILLAENPLRPALEVVYMGVHPSFRRRGVGQFTLEHGLALARRDGFGVVTLAVDAENAPALRLYHRHAFRKTLERRAMIRAITPNSARP
ncbi:MAG: GNAT family N-acetyltransferase [Phycisphaerae bacterium]